MAQEGVSKIVHKGLEQRDIDFLRTELAWLYETVTYKGLKAISEDRIKVVGVLFREMNDSSFSTLFGNDKNRKGLGILIQDRLFSLDKEKRDLSEESRRLAYFLDCLRFDKVEVGAFALAKKNQKKGSAPDLSAQTASGGVYTNDMESPASDQVPQTIPPVEVVPPTSSPQEVFDAGTKGDSGAEGNPGTAHEDAEDSSPSVDSTPGAEAQPPVETVAGAVTEPQALREKSSEQEVEKNQEETILKSLRAVHAITSDREFLDKVLDVVRKLKDSSEDVEEELSLILLRLEHIKTEVPLSRVVRAFVEGTLKQRLGEDALVRVKKKSKSRQEVQGKFIPTMKAISAEMEALSSDAEHFSQEKAVKQLVASFPETIGDSFDAVDFILSAKVPDIEVIENIGNKPELLQFLIREFKDRYKESDFETALALQTLFSGFERAEKIFSDEGYKDESKGEHLDKAVAVKLLVEECLKSLGVPLPESVGKIPFQDTLPNTTPRFADTEPGLLDGAETEERGLLDVLDYSYDHFMDLARKAGCPESLLEEVKNIDDVAVRDSVLKLLTLFSDRNILERYLLAGETSLFEEGRLSPVVLRDSFTSETGKDFITFAKASKDVISTILFAVEKSHGVGNIPEDVVRRSQKLFDFIDRTIKTETLNEVSPSDDYVSASAVPVLSVEASEMSAPHIEEVLSVEEFCRGVNDLSERLRDVAVSIEDVRGIQIEFATLISQRGGESQDQRVIDALVRLKDAIVDKREQIISSMKSALATGVESEDDERLLKYGEIRAFLDTFQQTVEGYIPEVVLTGVQEKKEKDGFFAKKVLRPAHAFMGRVKGLFTSRKNNKIPQPEGSFQKTEPVYADEVLSRYTEGQEVVDNNLLSVSDGVIEAGKARPREVTDEDIQEVISNVVKSQQVPAKQGLSTEDVSNLNIDVDPFADDDVSERKETRIKRMYEKLVVKPIDAYNNLPLSQKLAYSSLTVALMLGGFASVGATLAALPRVAGAYRAGVMWGGYRQNRLIQKGLAGIRPEPPPYNDREKEAKENMEYGAKRRAQVEGIAAGVAVFMLGTFAENIVALGSEAFSSLKDYTSGLFSSGGVPTAPGASSAPMSASAPTVSASAPEAPASASAPEVPAGVGSGAPSAPAVEVGTGGLGLAEKMPIDIGDTLTSVLLKEEVLRNIAGESFDSLTPQGKENLVANIVNLLGDKNNLAQVGLKHAVDVDRIFAGDSLNVEALKTLIEKTPLVIDGVGTKENLVKRALAVSARLLSR